MSDSKRFHVLGQDGTLKEWIVDELACGVFESWGMINNNNNTHKFPKYLHGYEP